MKKDLQKEHDELLEQLKEKCGQKGCGNIIIGWSIQDCLDTPSTAPIMKRMLELQERIKRESA